jgi:CheY-like chemotaxis protein
MYPSLAGRRILLVEDDYFIMDAMTSALESNGVTVVGPAARVEDALQLIDAAGHIDGAVIDINLNGDLAYPVADALASRGVPLIFATG